MKILAAIDGSEFSGPVIDAAVAQAKAPGAEIHVLHVIEPLPTVYGNVVATNPGRNSEFAATVGRVLHRPALLPAPGFALRLALGELADSLLLSSQRVLPERLLQSGYSFADQQLEPALQKILTH